MLLHNTPEDKHRIQQFAEVLRLQISGRLGPFQYYNYGLYKRKVKSLSGLDYMGLKLHQQVLKRLNPPEWLPVVQHKLYFQLHFGGLGIAVPAFYGLYDEKSGITAHGESLKSVTELDNLLKVQCVEKFVIKPVNGARGRKVLVLSRNHESGGFLSQSGLSFSPTQLAEHMRAAPFVVQEKIEQHEFLRSLNPYTINTFRLVTFRDLKGGHHIHSVALRMGRRGSETDNVSAGGLAIQVNRDTGVLGLGFSVNPLQPEEFKAHPDVGANFHGLQIPMWGDIKALCLRAAHVSPLGSVGWDVILSENGPVLVEGNGIWDSRQVFQRLEPYLRTEVREHLEEYGFVMPR
jgi:hypothetical protein